MVKPSHPAPITTQGSIDTEGMVGIEPTVCKHSGFTDRISTMESHPSGTLSPTDLHRTSKPDGCWSRQ